MSKYLNSLKITSHIISDNKNQKCILELSTLERTSGNKYIFGKEVKKDNHTIYFFFSLGIALFLFKNRQSPES